MHVAIPNSDKFDTIVNAYIDTYDPMLTIIHSTTSIGTVRKLKGNKVHAPVRGRHDRLASGIKEDYLNHIGYGHPQEMELARDYYTSKGITNVLFFDKYETTEAAKLLSLLQYGVNIEFARTANVICQRYGLDYEDVVNKYTKSYNNGIQKYNPELVKTILTPPKGRIGGHCVLQGVQVLCKENPDNLLTTILERNRKLKLDEDMGTK